MQCISLQTHLSWFRRPPLLDRPPTLYKRRVCRTKRFLPISVFVPFLPWSLVHPTASSLQSNPLSSLLCPGQHMIIVLIVSNFLHCFLVIPNPGSLSDNALLFCSKSRQNGVGGLKNGSSFHAIEDIAETWPGEVTEKYHLRQVNRT